jgi:Leucine-rich repeat (LRR) protein
LDTFPRVICHLQQIEIVDLSANRLRSLPDDTELWSTLNAIELILNQNQLSTLPTSLVGCRRLRVLRVQENCLGKSAFNATLLADSNLSLISYEGNLLQEKDFQQLPGYDQYQDRFTATKKKMF